MNFGQAIEALKQGEKVARTGWNGKGMWLFLVSQLSLDVPINGGRNTFFTGMQPFICMKTADEKFVPWLASQTDMLAEDWLVVS
ncbi:DUF2829 domain-containing protein [Brevibacillus sp. NRS-1366]|uniref:DUF2829 domain-containing protein n=1 Tax=Brevibacillus sp. NRS-1366 TaxID=3233899 RepID=UPI003D224A3A